MRFKHSTSRVSPRLAVLAVSAVLLGLGLVYPVFATTGTQAGPLIVSVTTSPNPVAIEGKTSVSGSAGVIGRGDLAGPGSVRGMLGFVTAPSSIGAEGYSAATSGHGYGLYGHAVNGNGVFGFTDSNAYASVYGESNAVDGTALYGSAKGMGVLGTSSAGNGVVGMTSSLRRATRASVGSSAKTIRQMM
jgi:hypothetical protein